MKSDDFLLRVLDCEIAVRCEDKASSGLLQDCYSAFLLPADKESRPVLSYEISCSDQPKGWVLQCDTTAIHCRSDYDLVYEFEKDMTQRAQLLRADLYFIHGAALSVAEHCVIISGQSGSGKSSLAWFLSHNGFAYLSDELAPVDPVSLQVEPYPHALCLKNEPLSPPPLPDSSRYTDVTIHVPAYELPTCALDRTHALGMLIFIDRSTNREEIIVRAIGRAESAARLYSNGLNQLAHQADGLPAVSKIAGAVPAYLLSGGTVEERGRIIQELCDSVYPDKLKLTEDTAGR
ncbi:MAG: hypothetical protein WBN23_01190 [Woeseia sp.]